jgi:transposase
VYYGFVPTGQKLNQEFYPTLLWCLQEAVQKKQPELWQEHSWFLHHNISMHMVLSIQKNNKTPVVAQPPYSSDLSPAEFFLFPKLKVSVKRRRFQSTEEDEEKC